MSELNLSGVELLAWCDETASRWEKFIGEHPAILQLPCDIAESKTVAELLRHFVGAELRYSERLLGLPLTKNEEIPLTLEALSATHRRAHEFYAQLLADSSFDWLQIITFTIRGGETWRLSAKKIFLQANLHTIRHYAQLHPIVRQHGFTPEWLGDFLGTDTMA